MKVRILNMLKMWNLLIPRWGCSALRRIFPRTLMICGNAILISGLDAPAGSTNGCDRYPRLQLYFSLVIYLFRLLCTVSGNVHVPINEVRDVCPSAVKFGAVHVSSPTRPLEVTPINQNPRLHGHLAQSSTISSESASN
jgi:hypothetical protein